MIIVYDNKWNKIYSNYKIIHLEFTKLKLIFVFFLKHLTFFYRLSVHRIFWATKFSKKQHLQAHCATHRHIKPTDKKNHHRYIWQFITYRVFFNSVFNDLALIQLFFGIFAIGRTFFYSIHRRIFRNVKILLIGQILVWKNFPQSWPLFFCCLVFDVKFLLIIIKMYSVKSWFTSDLFIYHIFYNHFL